MFSAPCFYFADVVMKDLFYQLAYIQILVPRPTAVGIHLAALGKNKDHIDNMNFLIYFSWPMKTSYLEGHNECYCLLCTGIVQENN